MTNPFAALARAVLGRFQHASAGWSFLSGRSQLNYAAGVGDGSGNSAVVACLRVLSAAFTEAPLEVVRRTKTGFDVVDDHALTLLLDNPNPHMSGELLWWATMAALHLDGNAYWVKVRSGSGRPVQLWPVMPNVLSPYWPVDRADVFIESYEYRPGGQQLYIDPADVVHFRLGLDPNNTRKGMSPLKPLLREVFTDNEAGDFSAQLLHNMGIPGVIISPDSDQGGLTPEAAATVKTIFKQRFSGDNRGEPMVMGGRTKVEILSFSPKDLDLAVLRTIPETRISGVLGVPAIVAGLDAGLKRSTFANFAEAREALYETTIIPLQRLAAGDIRRQLLPDFGNVTGLRVRFDITGVRVLQEDEDRRTARIWGSFERGITLLNEARNDLGKPPLPNGDIFIRDQKLIEVPVKELGAPKPLPALPAPKAPALPEPAKAVKWIDGDWHVKGAATSTALLASPDEGEDLYSQRLAAVGLGD